MGASGLVDYDNTPETEAGYWMLKEYWNKGYPTEASWGLLNYGFNTLGLKKIVSSAHTEKRSACGTLTTGFSTVVCKRIMRSVLIAANRK